MKSMNTQITRAIVLLMSILAPIMSDAAEYLFYFDVSDSAQLDQKAYLQEFDRFVEMRLAPGDRISVLLLNGETHNFSPILRHHIPPLPVAYPKRGNVSFSGQRVPTW